MARNKYDIDEALESEFNFSHLKRLFGYMMRYKKYIFIATAVILTGSLLTTLGPMVIKMCIDILTEHAGEGISADTILPVGAYMLLYVGIAIAGAVALRIKTRLMNVTGQNIIRDIRYDLFTQIQKLPFSYYDSRPHGKILVRVVNYVNSISDFLSNGVINMITDLFTLLVILVFMFCMNVELSLICLAPLPVFVIVLVLILKKQRVAWQIQSSKQSNMNAYIHENIIGMKVTQSFTREARNLNIFKRICEDVKTSWMHAKKYDTVIWPSIEIMSAIGLALLYIYAVPKMLAGAISVGTIVAFSAYIGMFWGPILNLSNFYNMIINVMAYLERIFETIDTKPSITDREGAVAMPPIVGAVEFQHVDFSYDEGHKILQDINFAVHPGETIALVGPTGAGKTTVINLLSRFYDVDSGKVRIDGVDISGVTLHSLRAQMGVMLQDTFIFSGTVMDNIRYGKLDATDEEVVRAAQVVSAHEFIESLENGYYTEVNERGSRLSVGQRQLISFARALLADPKILILDEATSSIDTKTEVILQKGLDELLKGRTSFIIAHRLSTIKNADRIMYIDQGRVMESGTHEELMEKQGYYYKLYEAQYSFLKGV